MRICALLITILTSLHSIESEPYRPSFSNVFTVEIQAIFKDSAEIDVSLYYDGPNNRTTVDIFSQNENTRKIFHFNEGEILSISGVECTVDNVSKADPADPLLSFLHNRETNEILPPEEIFHFQNSMFDKEDRTGFQPLYVYKGKTDIYGQKNCDVTHIFTTPDFTSANCDFRNCNSTLKSIILQCLNTEISDDNNQLLHRYDFFKFRDVIADYEIFQPPRGIFCNRSKTILFPTLPEYFSLSYDVLFRQSDIPTATKGEYVQHRTLWYDGAMKVIRVDTFKDNGGISERRIRDFKNGMIYETEFGIQKCKKSPAPKMSTLEETTLLPEIIFPWRSTIVNDELIITGERMTQGFQYEVWSSRSGIANSEVVFVRDFYFIKKYGEGVESDNYTLQLASIEQYGYATDGDSQNLQLQQETSFNFNHFLTSPRELIKFDVTDCFDDDEKFPFEIELTGPALLSFTRNQFLQALFNTLITSSSVSVARIGNLEITSQTENKTCVTGVIIESLTKSASTSREPIYKSEPDMKTTFNSLKSIVNKKKFSFDFTVNQKNFIFRATYFGDLRKNSVETSKGDIGYTGGAMAALAVVMLGIGAIIGGLGVFIYSKSRAKSNSNVGFSM